VRIKPKIIGTGPKYKEEEVIYPYSQQERSVIRMNCCLTSKNNKSIGEKITVSVYRSIRMCERVSYKDEADKHFSDTHSEEKASVME
jgi:hypothetical protein